jgi:hypothetical protein
VGGECVGGRCNVVTRWRRIRGRTEERGRDWMRGTERVVGRENNGL